MPLRKSHKIAERQTVKNQLNKKSFKKINKRIYNIMVYLKDLFCNTITIILALIVLTIVKDADAGSTRIAYKKSINGKTNVLKEKPLKLPTASTSSLTATTPIPAKEPTKTATTPTANSETTTTTTSFLIGTTKSQEELYNVTEVAFELNESKLDEIKKEELEMRNPIETKITTESSELLLKNDKLTNEGEILNENKIDTSPILNSSMEETPFIRIPFTIETTTTTEAVQTMMGTSFEVDGKTTAPSATMTTANSIYPVPCTCGVFLTSQLKGKMIKPEDPQPVIMTEMDRKYSCNAVGQKQCQTKCLETIVQHLPNSANILCATLNRNCHKERAYLFIKNCRNQWVNTSLTAGREYCCKNGEPYSCPLV